MGLSNYESEIRKAGGTTYLAIERFDRVVDGHDVHLKHQEDLAQALGLDWRDADAKFQDPAWPKEPKRATVRKIGELVGSIPGGDSIVERWIQQLTYNVAIGNNDAHAKNAALMHLPDRTELADVYDAVPNLFQADRVKWDLALAIAGEFDHRKMSTELLVAEIQSWGVIPGARAEEVVSSALVSLESALTEVKAPKGISDGMVEHIARSVRRLRAGDEISEPRR
jgi:serine/threonine-protein kinase HipA